MQIKIKICASVLLELMYFLPKCKKIKKREGAGVKQREGKKGERKRKTKWVCCRKGDHFQGWKGDHFQGWKVVSCLTLGNKCLRRHSCWQSKSFYWEGVPGQRAGGGKGTQENCSATWLAVLSFMVMGLVSRLCLANRSDSESFLVVHALLSQDGCQREGF